MSKINWGRVVMGGIVAGVVLTILAAVSTALVLGRAAFQVALQALRPSTSGIATPTFFFLAFVLVGILLTSSYAAIRPRFGAGLKTAAIAGLAVWLMAVCLTIADFAFQGIALGRPYSLPSGPVLPCLSLMLIITSTAAGASIYKEQQG